MSSSCSCPRVLLDGSGHDSAEIDGTVGWHVSAPTVRPPPAPRHFNIKTSNQNDLKNLNQSLDVTTNSVISKAMKQTHKLLVGEEKFIIDQESIESKKDSLISDNKMAKDIVNKENMESKVPDIQDFIKTNQFRSKSKDEISRQSETYVSQDNRKTKKEQLPIDLTPYMKYSVTTTEFTESMILDDYHDGAEDSNKGVAPKRKKGELMSSKHPMSEDDIQDYWRSMSSSGESKVPAELWETQFSIDISPCSGNEEPFVKNTSSRQGTISDTDSDGSPNRRRRSPSKRRTLGSSSGSDVALHEGAELSPMEDDQGTSITANFLSKQCTYPADKLSLSDMSSHLYVKISQLN